jgi:hypothetical protein
MGTKSFVQIDINAVFTTTSGKMQFRSGVFDHFKSLRNCTTSQDDAQIGYDVTEQTTRHQHNEENDFPLHTDSARSRAEGSHQTALVVEAFRLDAAVVGLATVLVFAARAPVLGAAAVVVSADQSILQHSAKERKVLNNKL